MIEPELSRPQRWAIAAPRSIAPLTAATSLATVLAALATAISTAAATASQAQPAPKLRQVQSLELLGEAKFGGRSLILDGVLLGGLSGLTYDAQRDRFYSISDDRSQNAPARFYQLQIQPRGDRLTNAQVRFLHSQVLAQDDQTPFAPNTVDPEGIVLTPSNTLWISSEGIAPDGILPFVREFSLPGQPLASLPIPQHYWPQPDWGVGDNLGFESLTLTPSGQFLVTAVENALIQDGPKAAVGQSSPARLLVFDLARQRVAGEYVYHTDPVVVPPNPANGFSAAGLVELLALDDDRFLALERMFAQGSRGMPGNNGMTVRLYEIDRRAATDVQAIDSLAGSALDNVIPVEKQLVLDLTTLGIPLSNLEGMALGPKLGDGRRSLLLISDDNFGGGEFTQILLFAINE